MTNLHTKNEVPESMCCIVIEQKRSLTYRLMDGGDIIMKLLMLLYDYIIDIL